MKKAFYILLALLPLLAGCTLKDLLAGGAGETVRFSAQTWYDNGPATKTAYSGKDENDSYVGSSSQYERIDWVNGDKLRIWMEVDASTNDAADYAVTSHATDATHKQNSNAEIAIASGSEELSWLSGTATHTFYSLYPSPATEGVDATKVTLNRNVITATIPSAQVVTAESGTKVFKPDMKSAFMWAATQATANQTDPIVLGFKPLMTAFEFTVGTAEGASALQITSFTLSAENDAPFLTGDFTATINSALNGYTVSNITGGSRAISVDFGASGVSASYASPITFTVFALPHQLTGLTIRFTLAGGATKSLALKKTVSGVSSFVSFDAGKKYRITNVYVPEPETWTYTIDVQDVYSYGHLATIDSPTGLPVTVKSYKTSSITGNNEPVGWKFQFRTPGGTWTDNLSEAVYSDKLQMSATTGSGSATGDNVRADIKRNHTSDEYRHHGQIDDAGTAALRARTPLPTNTSGSSSDGYFDLSRHPVYGTIDGSDQAQETANCYVITAPGKYKIPLVYGNAIRGGVTNAVAYAPTIAPGTNDNDHFMRQFLRHDDNPIAGPWITTDNGITVSDAVVVWQDGADTPDRRILFDGEGGDVSVDGNYIKFEIKKDNIRPGNILLAARNASGTIVWSWHLWVTDKDLTPISVKDLNNVTHSMLRYNLGWTDATSAGGYKWLDWDMEVRAVQVEGGAEVGTPLNFYVHQLGESGEVDPNIGSNTFYQWGRKDPILPANYGNSNKPFVAGTGYQILEETPGQAGKMRVVFKTPPASSAYVTVGHSIQHPNYQYARTITKSGQASGYGSLRSYLGGANPIIGNLWDANLIPYTNTAIGTPNPFDNRLAVKTVYDPCPPGFCVPYGYAFGGLTGSNNYAYPSNLPSGSNWLDNQGWELMTGFGTAKIFFPFCGARGGNGEYIYNVEELGYYWTSAPNGYTGSYALTAKHFCLNDNNWLRTRHDQDRAACYSVRAVVEVSPIPSGGSGPQSTQLPTPTGAAEQGW